MGNQPVDRNQGAKVICFSATASFTAGIGLLAVGTFTVCRADRSELAYAAIPLFFAVQQMIEGGLWLALPAQSPSVFGLTFSYLLFSNILWPIYVPLAILAIEPIAPRRRWLLLPIVAGALTGLFFLLAIVTRPVSATIIQSHIHYQLPHSHDKIAFAFYATATCLAPMLSSNKSVRLMGAVLIASMIAAYMIYSMWFASVWCYFAALISGLVFLHFRRPVIAGTQASKKQTI